MLPGWLMDSVESIFRILKAISLRDIIDIIGVAVLLYYVYRFIRDRRAGKLALGVGFIVVFLLLSDMFELNAMQFLLKNVFQVGLIALVVVFQPELRSALEKMGGESLRGIRSIGEQKDVSAAYAVIDAVSEAAADMSKTKTGALMVFERSTRLGDVINTGTVVNADATTFLIKNIFFNKAPLHDGAMIIRDYRVYAAGCLLPLSENPDIIKDLGTRHRAGIGMSENSDAVVVIVSEETGTISIAFEGKLKRNFTRDSLAKELRMYLVGESGTYGNKGIAKFSPVKIHKSADKSDKGGDSGEKK